MAPDSRREREKQARRESILDAAEHVFFGKGYERCTMDDIARQAQLSRALLYVYYKDKAAIMRAITVRAAECLLGRFREAVGASDTGMGQICNVGYAYYRFSVEQADYFDAITQAAGFGHPVEDDPAGEALMRCNVQSMQLMVCALARGVADGSLDPARVGDPLKTAHFLRGGLHGVIMESRLLAESGVAHPEPEGLVTYAIDMMGWSMRS